MALAGDVSKQTKSNGITVWALGKTQFPLVVSDIFDVTVKEILEIADGEGKILNEVVTAVCDARKIEEYTKDFGLTIISDKEVFRTLREEEVAKFVIGLVEATDKVAFLRTYFEDARIGDIVNVAISTITVDGEVWYNGEKEVTLILRDIFNVTIKQIFDWSATITKTETISDIVSTVCGGRTILAYVESIMGKEIPNNGLSKLLDVDIPELTDVMLGIKTDVPENLTKNDRIDYILNITDKIMIGEFVKGITYNEEDKVWTDGSGKAFGNLTQTIYKAPSSVILYIIAVIINPQLIVDAVGNKRIGSFIMDGYNKNDWFETELSGNDTDGFVVTGAFKELVEDISNVTVKEMYDSLFVTKTALTDLETKLLDRELGDYLFDLINCKFNSTIKICDAGTFADAYAGSDGKYVLTRNFSEVLERVFNLNIKQTINDLKTVKFGDFMTQKIESLTIGDIFYDLSRKYLKASNFKFSGYAWEFKLDQTKLFGKTGKALRAVYSIEIQEIVDLIAKKTKLYEFAYDNFGELTLGDILGAYAEALLGKSLGMKFVYNQEDDYSFTVEKSFAEIANALSKVTVSELFGIKKGCGFDFFFAFGGVLGDLPVGHLVGYLTKTKALANVFKNTTVEHETNAEWIISGTYSVPLDILCNDVKFADIYMGRNDLKGKVVLKFFSNVMAGHLLGGNKIDGFWCGPDGKKLDTHGAKNAVMNAIYDVTVGEALADGFDPMTIVEDLYVGQLMNYYYCSDEFKFSKVENNKYPVCVDPTHTDLEEGYHFHSMCEFESHTETTHLNGGWYMLEDGVFKEVGPIERAFAFATMKDVMSGTFSASETMRGITLGEAMLFIHCDGTECEIEEGVKGHLTHSEGWYSKVEDEITHEISYRKETVLMVKLLEQDIGKMFDEGLKLEEIYDNVLVGDALGFAHCWINGAGERVCTEELGHTDADHLVNTWFEKNETTGVYELVTPLERIVANIPMRKLAEGNFNIEDHFDDVTIGNMMGYEKCPLGNDVDCYVHFGTTCAHDGFWYDQKDDGMGNKVWVKVDSNLVLAIADFTLNDMNGGNFAEDLLNSVKEKVEIGDIFTDTDGTPLSIIPSNTKLSGINDALKTAFKTTNAGTLYDSNLLPFDDATEKKMDLVYGALVLKDNITNKDAYVTEINNALAVGLEVMGGVVPEDTDVENYKKYTEAVGRAFWRSLKITNLVDILLDAVGEI